MDSVINFSLLIPKQAPHRVLQTVIVHVKVGRVCGTADFWNVRGLACADVVPVDA